MKKVILQSTLFVFLLISQSMGQLVANRMGYLGPHGGMIAGGVGVSVIDDQTYLGFNLRPELAYKKFGLGLNINLLYDSHTGHIRSKDWDSSYDYLRIIRYLRWGRKQDPLYARAGSLDAARLGHGFIMNYYTNEMVYDERKVGLAFDLDLGYLGFEILLSNLGRAEIFGARLYYRPLQGIVKTPLLQHFTIGATIARDYDPDVWANTLDGVSVYGFDFELPFLHTKIFNSMFYFDWSQIHGYSSIERRSRTFGNGQAVGIIASLDNVLGLINITAKLERRWLGKEFVASFFDPFYELERFQLVGGVGNHKTDMLLGYTEESRGYFAEVFGGLLGDKIRLLGMLSRQDDIERSGILHLEAFAPDAVPFLAAYAIYDKNGVETVDDVFQLDSHSVARVGLGYKIQPYLILYMDYIWTFVETEPGSRIYKPQERIEPRLVFAYYF